MVVVEEEEKDENEDEEEEGKNEGVSLAVVKGCRKSGRIRVKSDSDSGW